MVANKTFDWIITSVILLQAIVLALEAPPDMHSFRKEGELVEARVFSSIHTLVVTVFIVEAALRLTARYPKPQSYKAISEMAGIVLILQSLYTVTYAN